MAGFDDLLTAGSGLSALGAVAPGLGIIGAGLSLFGGIERANASREAASQQAYGQVQLLGIEGKQEQLRSSAMEIGARRQQMEVFRNQQRARALALNNATSEGAQFGSGLQGGYGQISGQTGVNSLGISSALQTGEQMFGLNAGLTAQRTSLAMQGASAASSAAEGAGFQTLGGAMVSGMGTINSLARTFGPGANSYSTGIGSGGFGVTGGNSSADYIG